MNLSVIPGHGRLVRTPDFVAYLSEPDPVITDIVLTPGADPASTIRQLATHVVSSGFSSTSFVALSLVDHRLFVFGDLTVAAAGVEIAGSESTTFIERTLEAHHLEWVSVGDTGAVLADTSLELGCVAAGGFTLSAADDPSPTHRTGAPLQEISQAPSQPRPVDERPTEPVPVVAANETSPTVEPVASGPPDDNDDWDPLADPGSLDLAAIGAPDPVEIPHEPSAPAPVEAGTADEPTIDAAESFEQPTDAGPTGWTPPEVPTIGDIGRDPSTEDTLIPEPGAFPPPPSTDGSDEAPAVAVQLGFDDGQHADVVDGLLVGRYPHKNGLPEGFDGVVIRSEHVSRVHWRVTVDAGRAYVEDMGSQNGTFVQPAGRDERAPVPEGQRRELMAGDRIHFGDRWATVG